ncbi:MAG TPA: secondary thiamine-phosphate synthase enzyme YjbQ [Gammaproteobacteria bacterium]|nr:secondary thiamine-phosphate synthase enzyme YjbQ [Gammaproteobacteria bacterium]
MANQKFLEVQTKHRGFYNLDEAVNDFIQQSTVHTGLCHIFIPHTSASLLIMENWDSTVLKDLEAFMSRLVPDGDAIFQHTIEGLDDMPAHVRTALTQTAVSVPIIDNKLALGQWQGIFLWEHRLKPHRRNIIVTLIKN